MIPELELMAVQLSSVFFNNSAITDHVFIVLLSVFPYSVLLIAVKKHALIT
jgi:hypothetical protein